MRYSTKTRLLSGSAIVTAAFLGTAAAAQEATLGFRQR